MLGVYPFVEDPNLSVSAAHALAQLLPPCFLQMRTGDNHNDLEKFAFCLIVDFFLVYLYSKTLVLLCQFDFFLQCSYFSKSNNSSFRCVRPQIASVLHVFSSVEEPNLLAHPGKYQKLLKQTDKKQQLSLNYVTHC